MRKSLLLLGLLVAMAQPVLAQRAAVPGDSNGNYLGRSRGSNLLGALTPEQQAMWMRQDHVGANKADQENWRRQQSDKLAGMEVTQRQKLITRLQKHFDALPQKEQARIHQQMAERMSQQNAGLR